MILGTDWKKEGAFIGVEYVLQAGGYFRCPHTYDKVTGRVEAMPRVDHAMIAWVGPHGVQPKLVLDADQLREAGDAFVTALEFYRFLAKHNPFIREEQDRYEHPTKQGARLVSVTQIIKHTVAKDGLLNWYYEAGLEAALTVAHQLPPSFPPQDIQDVLDQKRCINEKELKREDATAWKWLLDEADGTGLTPTARRDRAGDIGSQYHRNVMFYLQGKKVDLTQAPPALTETMSRFAGWTTKHQVEPVLVEQMVFDDVLGYAGSLDAVLRGDETMTNHKAVEK